MGKKYQFQCETRLWERSWKFRGRWR